MIEELALFFGINKYFSDDGARLLVTPLKPMYSDKYIYITQARS